MPYEPWNGSYLLVHTDKEGGLLKPRRSSVEEYERVVAESRVEVRFDEDDGPHFEPVVFVALARVERNHDFTLGRPRDRETALEGIDRSVEESRAGVAS